MRAILQAFAYFLLRFDPRLTLVLRLPNRELYERILELRDDPNDEAVQVIRDALQTHALVQAVRRTSGVQFCIRKGTLVEEFPLDHLGPVRSRRGPFEVIKGGKE